MKWLLTHAKELCYEKKRRYPKKPMPFVYEFLKWCENNIDVSNVPHGTFSQPPQCMPDYCKLENTVDAYRNYYMLEKRHIANWGNSQTPEWFK